MAAAEDFIEAVLRDKRDDYDEERVRHKFLLDAYAGTGGFRGKVRMRPSGYWGPAAEMYADAALSTVYGSNPDEEAKLDTYLDRFPDEDIEKFRRRIGLANYVNHVARVVDIPLGYMARKSLDYSMPPRLEEWASNLDGEGRTWEELLEETIMLRAATVGYCPVLFDLPEQPVDELGNPIELTAANAEELRHWTKAIPLFPAHLLDWHTKGEDFEWCKIMVPYKHRPDAVSGTRKIERYSVFYRTHIHWWEVEVPDDQEPYLINPSGMAGEITEHPFGQVPVQVLRFKKVQDDPVRGLSVIENIAVQAKRHFNYQSELDEHIRKSVFAMMQVPVANTAKTGKITLGSGNALAIKHDWKNEYKWVSPPTGVADVLERRLENTRKEIYRQGNIEFSSGDEGGQAQSGLSRAYKFETTNRVIAGMAKRRARFEERCLEMAILGLPGIGDPDTDAIKVTPPTTFNIQELMQELEEAMAAVEMDLGPTAAAEIKKRVVRSFLQNVDEELLNQIEGEIEANERERANTAEQMRQAATELAQSPAGDDDDDEEDDDSDEDEGSSDE